MPQSAGGDGRTAYVKLNSTSMQMKADTVSLSSAAQTRVKALL